MVTGFWRGPAGIGGGSLPAGQDGQVLGYGPDGDLVAVDLPTGSGGGTSVAWTEITGKPTSFAPSAHSHPIGEVTGLQGALDGKSATGHSHAWAEITGKPTTFAPAVHAHVVSDVTGLQAALDGKAATTAIPTTEQMQDLVAAMFQAGTHTNATVVYDDAAGTISISAAGGDGTGGSLTQEQVEDIVGSLVQVQGTGIAVAYDDAGNVLRISLTGESYTTAEKNKLAAIAAGATANATDAQLRDRATHTGTQAIATVTGLQAALDAKAATGHAHAIADVTGLQGALDGKSATGHSHAWTEITGKPATFAPSAHSHAISEVTGLQAALDDRPTLSQAVISTSIRQIVSLTQAAYDALGTPDPATLYVVT